MDLQALAAAALAARTKVLEVGARRVSVVLPTRHELALAYAKALTDAGSAAALVSMQRQLLVAGTRSWDLVGGDVVAEGGVEALPCTPEAVALVLDEAPLGADLAAAFSAALTERQQAAEAARKN